MARIRKYSERVNVIKMVKLNGKWPFARVVERNGRIIRDRVWVAGREEHHPEGRYYLEWYEEGRRRRKPVESFDLVLPAARAKSIELSAVRAGLMTLPEPATVPIEPTRLTMDEAIDQYLEYIRKHRSLRTYRTYRPVLHVHFRNSYTKTHVDEVERGDILKFMSDMFDDGLVARTVYDRLVTVLQLFKRHGHTGLVERSDWPNYVETIRPIYEPDEITAMLDHAKPDEATLIKFCLATGFRDREIRYAGITPGFFRMLGVPARMGRMLNRADDMPVTRTECVSFDVKSARLITHSASRIDKELLQKPGEASI